MDTEPTRSIHRTSRMIAMINGFLPEIYLLTIGIWNSIILTRLKQDVLPEDKRMENLLKIIFYLLIPSITLLSNSFRLLYFKFPCLAPIFGYYYSCPVLNIKTVMGIEMILTFSQLFYQFWIAVSVVPGINSATWKIAFQYMFLFLLQFYITLNFLIHKSCSVFNYRLACKRNEIKLKKRILERSKS